MDIEEFLRKFVEDTEKNYSVQLGVIRSTNAKSSYDAVPKPVSNGRLLLMKAEKAPSQAGKVELILGGQAYFDIGAIHPDSSEWPIDGVEYGRANACMWSGISRVLLHEQSDHALEQDATKADTWFGIGLLIFLQLSQFGMAGRITQEWAESRRLKGDQVFANVLFLFGTYMFAQAGMQERLEPCHSRIDKTSPSPVDSAFFLGRPATIQEANVLTTVLGGQNTENLYRATQKN